MNKKIVSALTVAGLATFGMSSAASADSTYTIKRGDTLSSIARQHSVSVQALAAANQLSNPNMIFAGQQLSLTGNVQNQTKQVSQKQTGSTHTIQPGETLSRIAREYGVSVQELVALNHLSNPSMIYAGEELTVKGQAGSVAQPEVQSAKPAAPVTQSSQQVDVNASTHTIKAGDTLSSIARQYGTTVDKLVALNQLNNAGMIFVGEQLTLRGEV
ncbi:LysM peptidoglycan-binding domain-containing protein, partial [Weissella halotolerans]